MSFQLRLIVTNFFRRYSWLYLLSSYLQNLLRRRKPPIITPWGFSFLGNESMARGEFEVLETRLVRRLLGHSEVLINIGANIGYYCCHALSLGKSVYAFEPIAENLYYLYRNIELNNWSKSCYIYPVALSNESGLTKIWGGGTGASLLEGWSGNERSVFSYTPSFRGDAIIPKDYFVTLRPLIIIDVEGWEYSVLNGAAHLLDMTPRPIWLVEITRCEHQPLGISTNPHFQDTFKLFFMRGYRAFIVDKTLIPINANQISEPGNGEWFSSSHNYIFCEENYVEFLSSIVLGD